jgi:protein subunit release factor A
MYSRQQHRRKDKALPVLLVRSHDENFDEGQCILGSTRRKDRRTAHCWPRKYTANLDDGRCSHHGGRRRADKSTIIV